MNTTEASNNNPPLGLRLSELLGVDGKRLDMSVVISRRRWTQQMVEARIALVCACLALTLQLFAASLTLLRVLLPNERIVVRAQICEAAYGLLPEWVCSTESGRRTLRPEQCPPPARPTQQ